MYEVFLCNYDNLPNEVDKELGLPNNGSGKEYAGYIVVKVGDKVINVHTDAMEPEDASFHRDLRWVMKSLKEAYLRGLEYGIEKKIEGGNNGTQQNS